MVRLKGHFDGNSIILDDPVPADVPANSAVEVVVLPQTREQALAAWEAFLDEWWKKPYSGPIAPRTWTREDLHERR